MLVALLSAMGVVGDAEQRAWTAARERLVRLRDQPESAPPVAPIGSQRRRRRWAAGAVLLAVILIIAVIVTVLRPSAPATNTLTATMGCVPASCAAHGPTLVLRGRLNGSVPPDSRVVVMILVDNTQRWYLGPTVGGDDVEWTREIGIGNRVPQPRDRGFTVCLHLISATSVERLTTEMIARAGEGLAEETLSSERVELACVPAVRVRDT